MAELAKISTMASPQRLLALALALPITIPSYTLIQACPYSTPANMSSETYRSPNKPAQTSTATNSY